jgi:lipid-A-disaccharide synthase-like uncharacterized protein
MIMLLYMYCTCLLCCLWFAINRASAHVSFLFFLFFQSVLLATVSLSSTVAYTGDVTVRVVWRQLEDVRDGGQQQSWQSLSRHACLVRVGWHTYSHASFVFPIYFVDWIKEKTLLSSVTPKVFLYFSVLGWNEIVTLNEMKTLLS